jgi:hypothetical protein
MHGPLYLELQVITLQASALCWPGNKDKHKLTLEDETGRV